MEQVLKARENVRIPPKKEKKNESTLSTWFFKALIKMARLIKAENKLLYRIIQLSKYTGLRRSEVLGLRDEDILEDEETDGGIIVVRFQLHKEKGIYGKFELRPVTTKESPKEKSKKESEKNEKFSLGNVKTSRGIREVPLIKQCKEIIEEQKEVREQQKAMIGEENWKDDLGLIFTHLDGSPIDPNLATSWFREIRDKAIELESKIDEENSKEAQRAYEQKFGEKDDGIRLDSTITPHKFRHLFASILAANGYDKDYIAILMGHVEGEFSMEQYTHPLSEAQRKAAHILEGHFSKEENEPHNQ